jgi:HSP20 family molecular chaperone IbpA
MAIVKRSDFFGMDFDTLFEELFGTPVLRLPDIPADRYDVTAEVKEGEFKVVAKLPGLKTEDIKATIEDGVLTIEGESKVGNSTYSYRHVLDLPEVVVGMVHAEHKDGVLTITIPLLKEIEPEVVTIPISRPKEIGDGGTCSATEKP